MGQKVNPIGMRLGIIRDWDSRWYAGKATYRAWVLEDARVRRLLRERFASQGSARGGRGGRGGSGGRGGRGGSRDIGISRVEIERAPNLLKLTLHTAKPGLIIGRGGRGVEDIRSEIEKIVGGKVHINVQEIRQPELDAMLVAENVAGQIERRIAFKRAVRQALQRSMKMGAKGIRVLCSGRLGGAEMSRKYWDRDGKIPLHTFRADIDYGFTEARTAAGNIGIKVWLYRGDILPEAPVSDEKREQPAAAATERPRRGWRRVGPARRVSAEDEETAGAEAVETAGAEAVETAGAEAADEAGDETSAPGAAAESTETEAKRESEERKTDADAVEGQAPETP